MTLYPYPTDAAAEWTEASAASARASAPARAPDRLRAALAAAARHPHLLAGLLFVACAVVLFRLSLIEGWTFVGDSDRLNTALNVRLFETDAIRARGSVPTWSEHQFMGSSIVGLHWLLTAYTPVPYLLALLPPSELYHALAILAAVMLALAAGAAYWAFGVYVQDPVSRVVGALLYALGSYTVHKLTQLDVAFLALVLSPVLLRLVREARRETAPRSFLLIALCWASLVLFTVLQEIAYIGLLAGTYALYRAVRTRDPWPLAIAGLAFACATLIGMPRVLTVATESPLVARTSNNIETAAVEALRYFGDGLLGREPREQRLVRGNAVNLHEGVQLLHSALAALAVLAVGLLARSWVVRAWAVGLAVVLSVALVGWFERYYDVLGVLFVWLPFYTSPVLHVFLANAVLIGVPLWLLGRWLAGRAARASQGGAGPGAEGTPDAVADSPFFFGFVTLGLAGVLIPEARSVLYHAFMRMDLMHSRLSVAMTLPLAALAAIFVSRLIAAHGEAAAARWLLAGLVVGAAGWLVREGVVEAVLGPAGEVLNILQPRRLLTVETVRVGTSLLALAVVVLLFVRRSRPRTLVLAGGALAAWMVLETTLAADFKLNGPQVREQSVPFHSLNYMQTPPGLFNVPTPEQRALVRGSVEADAYRVVLVQNAERFDAHVEPHLAAFWNVRLVEGYSTGFPRRLAALPWDKRMYSPHFLDIDARHTLPWRLLAALNVKYALVVDRSLWYNPAPGTQHKPISADRLEVLENPYPVTPRAFFAASVEPAGAQPRFPGDDGVRPPPEDPQVGDPAALSVVEGWPAPRQFSTAGTLSATFDGDRVLVRVDPAAEDRFLVLNEMPHPGWVAWVDGQPAPIYPTNLVMRGILVPAGASTVELRFTPFIASPAGLVLFLVAAVVTALAGWALARGARRGLPWPARRPGPVRGGL